MILDTVNNEVVPDVGNCCRCTAVAGAALTPGSGLCYHTFNRRPASGNLAFQIKITSTDHCPESDKKYNYPDYLFNDLISSAGIFLEYHSNVSVGPMTETSGR